MVLIGFYLMYLGFLTPPNPLSFFLGLIVSVFGLILVIMYGSRMGGSRPKSRKPQRPIAIPKEYPKPKISPKEKEPPEIVEKEDTTRGRRRPLPKPVKPQPKVDIEPTTKTEPKKGDKVEVSTKPVPKTEHKPEDKVEDSGKPAKELELKPIEKLIKPQPSESKPEPKFGPVIKAREPEKSKEVKDYAVDKKPIAELKDKETSIKPKPELKLQDKSEVSKPISEEKSVSKPKPEIMVQKEPEKETKKEDEKTDLELQKEDKAPIKPVFKRPSDDGQTGDQYVKDRLEKLKKEYFQDTEHIENIIDERLDSFKGTLSSLKTESTEPSIIWSFEAQDVQGAMKDTVSSAESKILLMYPWVRNIDVSILKKFMEIDSKMIIQEASLDDDASVELIRLLMQNQVQIRTMPHVHTVALVSDDSNGLIISTDPIYESYEVGVIYKDKKSILEIEKMFEEAWNISKEIDMEYKE
jgi:hypothetical protein